MPNLFKSSAKNKPPGVYREASSHGNPILNGRIITLREGDILPPTRRGRRWIRIEMETD